MITIPRVSFHFGWSLHSLWLKLTLVITIPSLDSLYVRCLSSLLCEHISHWLSTLLCIKVSFSKWLFKKDRLCDSERQSIITISIYCYYSTIYEVVFVSLLQHGKQETSLFRRSLGHHKVQRLFRMRLPSYLVTLLLPRTLLRSSLEVRYWKTSLTFE